LGVQRGWGLLWNFTCDICVNSIHKYIYIFRSGKCQYSVCNVLCKCIALSVKMENYDKNNILYIYVLFCLLWIVKCHPPL
jgi:hypothetical protein